MVGEVTMICVDNGKCMMKETGEWFWYQLKAVRWYCETKLKAHPDNLVGLVQTGARNFGVALLPTRDFKKVMRALTGVVGQWQSTNLLEALVVAADFGRFRHKNLKQRIVVFAGNPLDFRRRDLKKTLSWYKETQEDASSCISDYLSTSQIAPHPVAAAEGGSSSSSNTVFLCKKNLIIELLGEMETEQGGQEYEHDDDDGDQKQQHVPCNNVVNFYFTNSHRNGT
ncbi:26S proteasome non-ATPase regulatory subunit 4, partial [Tanacetum coccineum]